jgi:O-antigen/teichoic acid export membrane protein
MSSPSVQQSRLARNFAWLALSVFFVRLIGLVTAIYLARTLSLTTYGELGIALSIVAIVGTLVRAGTGTRATRLTAVDPSAIPNIYADINGFRVTVAMICIAALWLLSPLIAKATSVPKPLLILCTPLLLSYGLTVVWAFRGLDKMHIVMGGEVAEKLLMLLGLLMLVRGEGNDVLWVPVVEIGAALTVVWWLRHRLGRLYSGLALRFRTSVWPTIAREAVPFGLAGVISAVYMSGIVPLLGWLSTADAAAGFLVAQKVMLTLALFLLVINQASFPSMSRLLSREQSERTSERSLANELRSDFNALALQATLLRYYLLLTTPLFLLALNYSSDLLALLFGENYRDAGPILVILLSALPFLAANNSMALLLRAIPRPGSVLTGRMVGIFVLLTCAVILIPVYGARGAATALVSAEIAVTLIFSMLVWRATGGLPVDIRCLGPIVAGLMAAMSFLMTPSWPEPARLLLASAVYVAIVFLARSISLNEIRMLGRLGVSVIQKPFS